jgi:hypothetical protein
MADSGHKEFVAQLERERKKRGLSVAAWCRTLEVNESVYHWWLKGRPARKFMRECVLNRMKGGS